MIYKLLLICILNLIIFSNLKRISLFINLYDFPDKKRKIHTVATPSIGGVILFTNLTSILLFDILSNNLEYNYLILFLTSAVIFFISLIDDKFNITPNKKFFFIGLAVFFFIFFNGELLISRISFDFYKFSIKNYFLKFFITWLCIMLFLNAMNLYDGVNCQLGLYTIFIFSFFLLNDIFFDLSLLIIIFLFFFTYFNFKNKIFLGDNGSFLLAFIIAFIIISNNSTPKILSAEKIFLLMFVPGLDMLRLFIERLFNNRNPFIADKFHIHHLFLQKISQKKFLFLNVLFYSLPIILSYKINNIFLIFVLVFLYILLVYKYLNHNFKN